MIRRDWRALLCQCDGHFGMFRKKIGHQVFMIGINVMDCDEGHAGLIGQRFKEIRKRLHSTGRGTKTNHRDFGRNRVGLGYLRFRRGF
ncbi:MAG: hypothetical protein WBV78_15615 [Roseobacter sp.]